MNIDQRRSERISDYLPVAVFAFDGLSQERASGPFSGRIIDISRHGACLLMSQIIRHSFHIFYSTRERTGFSLQLAMDIPPQMDGFILAARPVWLDLYRQQEVRAFKMGVEFLASPEGKQMRELQNAIKRQQRERATWWRANTTP